MRAGAGGSGGRLRRAPQPSTPNPLPDSPNGKACRLRHVSHLACA